MISEGFKRKKKEERHLMGSTNGGLQTAVIGKSHRLSVKIKHMGDNEK